MSAHTPGPWTAHPVISPPRELPHALVSATTLIARVYSTAFGDHPQAVANARLMAAAPDLLALAHQYASECGDCAGERIDPDDETCETCADIWRVIDKAEGRA